MSIDLVQAGRRLGRLLIRESTVPKPAAEVAQKGSEKTDCPEGGARGCGGAESGHSYWTAQTGSQHVFLVGFGRAAACCALPTLPLSARGHLMWSSDPCSKSREEEGAGNLSFQPTDS